MSRTGASSDDNTNLFYLTDSKLGPFANRATRIYKCPADREPAPNGPRIRSMSMNAMVGDPGELTNRFNPLYVQFFKCAEIRNPSGIFVFLDEQADTLNDGFFVNSLDDYAWGNLPGSYHNGGVQPHLRGRPPGVAPLAGARHRPPRPSRAGLTGFAADAHHRLRVAEGPNQLQEAVEFALAPAGWRRMLRA